MLFHGKDGNKDGKKEDNDEDWNFRNLCITNLLERVLLGLESKRILIKLTMIHLRLQARNKSRNH